MSKSRRPNKFDHIRELFIVWTALCVHERRKDERTIDQFAEKWGVDPSTLFKWKLDDEFQAKVDILDGKVTPDRMRRLEHAMYTAGEVERDVQAAKLIMEVKGKYTPKLQVEGEIGVFKKWNDAAKKAEDKK